MNKRHKIGEESVTHLPNPDCVVKMGDGRGFIIVYRMKLPLSNPPLKLKLKKHLALKPAPLLKNRLVVTAAHCLPHLLSRNRKRD
jgi:hypothetical protein